MFLNSISGMGFQDVITDLPLYLNVYPMNLGVDPKVMELIMKERSKVKSSDIYGIFTNNMQMNTGIKHSKSIILFPGLGMSKIFAKWDFSGTNTESVKSLDIYKNFETKTKWNCKSYQKDWIKLWFPEYLQELATHCWSNNIEVKLNENTGMIEDKPGLTSTVHSFNDFDFENNYLESLITLLESKGYVKGVNLFVANYDFRLICNATNLQSYFNSIKNLVEKLMSQYLNKVIFIGHDLGAVLANLFLVQSSNSWKNEYINKFISINGSFGGCPKALRVLLNGEEVINKYFGDYNKTQKNFSGIHLLLPNPSIFQNKPILKYQQNIYSAKDIGTLLKLNFGNDCFNIYNTTLELQNKSLEDPNVNTYFLFGNNLQTESLYDYKYSLLNNPTKINPYNKISYANENKSNYNNFNPIGINDLGDGTILSQNMYYIINKWKQSKYKFYDLAEHQKILCMFEPLNDLSFIIDN